MMKNNNKQNEQNRHEHERIIRGKSSGVVEYITRKLIRENKRTVR